MRSTLAALVLLGALAAPAAADRASDDLAAVRRAVASSGETRALPAEDPEQAPAVAKAKPQPRKGAPHWFRLRIVEKADKHSRVSIDLPLGLVRALGGDWPLPECRHHDHSTTIGDVLRALDSGQSLVNIEDEEASIRVWVD